MATQSNGSARASRLVVEQDFNAAIDRLVAGKPDNKKLCELAASGRLSITFATVALEAGRSRSLIAHRNCAYQDVRSRVVTLMEDATASKGNTTRDKIAKLRQEIVELEGKLVAALDAQVENFLAREKAEREANKWREAFKRLKADSERVVPLRKT